MKMKYGSPNILKANGVIDLTVSQEAEMGTEAVAEWNDWWTISGDDVENLFPDFNVNDPTTWPPGFDLNDSGTWDILLGFEP